MTCMDYIEAFVDQTGYLGLQMTRWPLHGLGNIDLHKYYGLTVDEHRECWLT